MNFTHARIDKDGLIVALLNATLISNIEHQSFTVQAPLHDPPLGNLWQWSDDQGWKLITDMRGKIYVSPVTGEKFMICNALDKPPEDYVLEGT